MVINCPPCGRRELYARRGALVHNGTRFTHPFRNSFGRGYKQCKNGKPMPSNLRTVLRDSYVGHVMCAAFLVSAIHSIGRAIDHPFENTVTNLLHDLGVGSTSQSSELGVLLTIEFVNAVAGILLALIFWR